jgi:glycerate dehydrogenase
VDEQAVADALETGKIRGFAADVVSAEPIRENNPLLTASGCILTPHMAWAPIESRKRIIECTIASIRGFLAGNPINVVNL